MNPEAQDVANETDAGRAREDCLRNHLVVRKIFQHFSNPELLKLSFVNKLWKHEARSAMRKRDNLIAHLRCSDQSTCQKDLEALVGDDVGQRNVIPFSGINIEVDHWHSFCGYPAETLSRTYPILDRLPLRNATIELQGYDFWKTPECPGFWMAKQVLRNLSGALEQLTLKVDPTREVLIKNIEYCSFPRLKILKLTDDDLLNDEEDAFNEAYTKYIKALLFRAPNLQELHIQKKFHLAADLLEGSPAALVLKTQVCAPFDEIPESLISAVRLENMKLFHTQPEFDFQRFNRITPRLLKAQASSTSTVHRILVDAVLAVALMSYGIRLDNVVGLDMYIHHTMLEFYEPRILRLVKNFDFTRLFPSLNRVTVWRGHVFELELTADMRAFCKSCWGLRRIMGNL